MAFVLPQEVADFLEYVQLPTPPELPAFVTHAIVQVPSNHAPWFRYEQHERSDDLTNAALIVLQSNFLQIQR
jgi:hypothetical protein